MAVRRDSDQVLNAAYDPSVNRLKVTVVGVAGAQSPLKIDINQIWSRVFDPATGTLRVSRVT